VHIEVLRDTGNRTVPPSGLEGSSLNTTARRMNYVACITVTRHAADDAGVREIYVSVDGEEIAVLKNGQAVTHELPAGPHRLQGLCARCTRHGCRRRNRPPAA